MEKDTLRSSTTSSFLVESAEGNVPIVALFAFVASTTDVKFAWWSVLLSSG